MGGISSTEKGKVMAYPVTAKACNVTTCSFGERRVRIANIDGKLWFVLDDVTVALDCVDGEAIDGLPEDWIRNLIVDSHDGFRDGAAEAIAEPALYFLLGSEQTPKARLFRKWLLEQALPTVHRTGPVGPAVHIRQAQAMATKVGATIARDFFNAILDDPKELSTSLYVVYLSYNGEPEIHRLEDDERVVSVKRFSQQLREGRVKFEDLKEIADASVSALHRRTTYLAERHTASRVRHT
jgi:prophage antirepressor-like protein